MKLNKEKLLPAIFFGIVAHYSLPIILLFVKVDNAHISELDVLKAHSSWLFISPLFWSGVIWGYLMGSNICKSYIKTKLGILKSAFIGLSITILCSLTQGYLGSAMELLEGKIGLIGFFVCPIWCCDCYSFFHCWSISGGWCFCCFNIPYNMLE